NLCKVIYLTRKNAAELRLYNKCLLANKIIQTTKDIGSYFSDVMDVCQHAISYDILYSRCKFTKKIPSNKEMVKILLLLSAKP
ncbi:MAG: hypothetical protein ACI36Z_07265, partial [Alloprevotella sp.]